jgi:hypothetical protein
VKTEGVIPLFLVILDNHVEVLKTNEGASAKKKGGVAAILTKMYFHGVSYTYKTTECICGKTP